MHLTSKFSAFIQYLQFFIGILWSTSSRIQDGQANYVACHNESYVEVNKFDVVRYIKRGGSFFLNTRIASLDPDVRIQAIEEKLSPKILRTM